MRLESGWKGRQADAYRGGAPRRAIGQTAGVPCRRDADRLDYLQRRRRTDAQPGFSGDGEPTLNPDFAPIVDGTIALRDRFYPSAMVSVLSNATRLRRPGVFEALRKVDNPILKLDAPTDAAAAMINQPAGEYHVADIVEDLARFEGAFVLQTMFLKAPDFRTETWVGPWMDIVRRLRPREVMVYTLDRETPQQGLEKYTPEEMCALVQPLIDEGFTIQIKG